MNKADTIEAFYSLPIAVAIICLVFISILFYLALQERRKERRYRERYPQASKPHSKIIPFNTVKN